MASIDYAEAAHMLRRAGFGGNPDEINALVARGSREAAVDYLINYETVNNQPMEALLAQSYDFSDGPRDNATFNQNLMRSWWFTRMITTARPFEEKMTLFWHNHFATALSGVQDVYMFNQNLLLRQNALGRFDDLLLKVAQDPAMLLWLDSVTSTRTSPNENWSRELQELFTMGIHDVVTGEANYTEDDVKEIARAFTGWRFRRTPGNQDPFAYTFFVDNNQFDAGPKTIYGQTANFTGQDVITVVANRRATGRYLVYKLFTFFVHPLDLGSASDRALIDRFADVYVSSNHSIRTLVRAIFTSDEFFSSRARYALIKTPVEYIVGSIRMLRATYVPVGPPNAEGRRGNESNTYVSSRLMGMDIFNPPDVAGWELNLGWVNTAVMLERYNFANRLATNRPNNTANPGFWIPAATAATFAKGNAKKTVGRMLETLNTEVAPVTNKQLRSYLTTNDQGQSVEWVISDQNVDKKIRGLIHQIMSLPEFQMN